MIEAEDGVLEGPTRPTDKPDGPKVVSGRLKEGEYTVRGSDSKALNFKLGRTLSVNLESQSFEVTEFVIFCHDSVSELTSSGFSFKSNSTRTAASPSPENPMEPSITSASSLAGLLLRGENSYGPSWNKAANTCALNGFSHLLRGRSYICYD